MTVRVDESNTETIAARFQKFHEENPEVYRELVSLAREIRDKRGYQKFGIATIYEVARWRSIIRADKPADEFKLNNNFRAYYARLIMDQEEDLAGFFDTRRIGSETHVAP
jgi:hypothetical protein